jgi:glycosyltransferase involved in cell wall biosynthesis
MRIAVVESAHRGGLLHYAVQLGDALAARDHSVDLLTTRGNELGARVGAARMRAVLRPPVTSPEEARSKLAYLARRGRIALRLCRWWVELLRELRRGRYDAAILTLDLAQSLSAAAALGLTALPGRPRLAAVCHNVRPFNRWTGDELFVTSRLLLGLLRRLYARLDLVLVHGESSRREFEERWPPARLAVIPHGDERLFADDPPAPAEEERILFFGDWRKVKGLPVLMEAFDQLVTRRPAARLTIAGTPSHADGDPDAVRRWAKGHGDSVRVIDHYVPMEQVPEVFGQARAVVAPYLVGYQSGVVHLAMTMGRAVVASGVGDLGSVVIDGETGRIVPPGDPRALAAALEEVVADREGAERLGAEGRRRMLEGSGWEAVAERVEAALLEVLQDRS